MLKLTLYNDDPIWVREETIHEVAGFTYVSGLHATNYASCRALVVTRQGKYYVKEEPKVVVTSIANQEGAARAVELIMETLLALPWDQRGKVMGTVRSNPIFCSTCGYGSVALPNPNCQCENDE